jgi:hypothetical protein
MSDKIAVTSSPCFGDEPDHGALSRKAIPAEDGATVAAGGVVDDGRAAAVTLEGAGRPRSDAPTTTMPTWRADIDSLAFRPDGHDGLCMVHRRAFRTLLKRVASAEDCADFFRCHQAAFQAAARAKIVREALGQGANFHLTSRDIARQIGI